MAYNEFAYFYDEFNGEADYDALYSHIHSQLEAHGIRDGIVADLGCGTGELTLMLTQAGYDVIGIDRSEEMLSVLREKADELPMGTQLPPERELAQQMQVSRAVVNGGLAELAQQGFLEVRPRQGTFVADYRRKGNLSTLIAIMEYQGGVLGKDEIRSILEVRRALEHLAAQRAIRYASDEALARLGDIVARIAAAQNNAQAAFAFQHELALAGGNSILPLIYYSFKAPVITLWLRFCRMYGIGALCRNTETLYNYLCRRDMDGAERWIDAYLEQAIDGSQQIYEER